MSEIVERVARALYELGVNAKLYSWNHADAEEKDHARRYARAAIEAAREPTEAMMLAIGKTIKWGSEEQLRQSFRDAIDEALN